MNDPTVQVTKRCRKCGEEKAAHGFYAHATQADGLYSWCRLCCNARAREKRAAARKPGRPYEEVFAERFWSKVDKDGPVPEHAPELGKCWIWTAYRDPFGYGELGRRNPRRNEQSHRVAWEFANGPAGALCVLHKCDRPSCVRADHLFLGTRTENMADKVRKGRQRRGSRQPGAILNERTAAEVKALLASGAKERAVAERFGVTRSAICAIAQGRTWKHVG